MTRTNVDAVAVRDALLRNLAHVVTAPHATLLPVVASAIAGGHMLLEGVPGVGKTLLARTLAQSLDGEFRRIQFTADLMPSDVLGAAVWRPDLGKFTVQKGPLFANVVLADEINRTSPRTLSCLLEAMESGHATLDGRTMELGQPFLVLATRNPIEFHGTFPLPEAALDRFLVRIALDYPDAQDEIDLYVGVDPEAKLAEIRPALTREEALELRAACDRIVVSRPVAEYALAVAQATRRRPEALLGASPRAAMSWLRLARAHALLDGRGHVLPDDLKALAVPALAHRVFLRDGGDAGALVGDVVRGTATPL